jgi:very-short-patch-repair endonuclease
MAATLPSGNGAVLSHRSAAALWGIGEEPRGLIEVSVPSARLVRRPGIHVRHRTKLRAVDVGEHRGVPVTAPVRTLIDLATLLPSGRLERAVNEADKRDLVDPESLRAALESRSGEAGVRALKRLLDRHTFRLSDQELEVLFRPIAVAAGLPTPQTKEIVDGFEVDFFWPGLGLVVETDGWRYHRTPAAQSRDALRFQTHTAAGRTPLRFSHFQVAYEARHVQDVLSRTAANLRPG